LTPLPDGGQGGFSTAWGSITLEPEGEPEMPANEKSKPEIKNYQMDPRLKAGRDYPFELISLVKAFKTGEMGLLRTNSKEKIWSYQRQISLVEKTFREYFLHTVQGITSIKTTRPGKTETIEDPEEIKKRSKRIKNIDPIHLNCIRRVNARLKYFTPRLKDDIEHAYKLEPFYLGNKKDPFGEAILWAHLAMTIDSKEGIDPELVHECLYCKKIFFSRQRKKYHPECQSKYFSEKAVREGIAKKRQKDYRERKKKNIRIREKS
jgi:hypothetical protein